MTTVTEDQVTLLRRVFDTYNARDVEALVELHHEDFELIPSPYYERRGTVFRGREGLRPCLEDVFTRFAKCEVSVDGFRELGDWVLLRMSAVDEDEPYPGAVGEVIWLYAIKDDLVIGAYGFLSEEDALAAAAGTAPRSRPFSTAPAGHGSDSTPKLTRREREVFALLACGHNAPQIAAELFLSPATVRTPVQNG